MAEKKLSVGIAGYGVVGKRRHHFLEQHPQMHVVSVCDQYFSDSSKNVEGLSCHTNYQELLKEDLDVLFVCLPNYLAPEVTIAGLEKGLHVFCEKPPGRSVEDIEAVRKVEAEHPDCVLKYGFNHRYHDSVREALEIVESGELGEILNIRGVYGKSKIIPFIGEWRSERKFAGGGILLDQGIHMVDLMSLFCGDFEEVKSFVSNDYWDHDVEDNAYAVMKNKAGQFATLHSSATQWQHRFQMDIALSGGCLELRGLLTGSKSYGEETLVIGRQTDDVNGIADLNQEIKKYDTDNSWRDEIAEFADAILNGGSVKYGLSDQALQSMKLVYRIYYADPVWREKFNISNPD